MAKAHSQRIEIDLTTERTSAERIEVGARRIAVLHIEPGDYFEIAVDSWQGPFFRVDRAGIIELCGNSDDIEAIYVRNPAGSGSVQLQTSGNGLIFDFPGGTADVAAPVVLAEFAPRQEGGVSAPVLISGNGGATAPAAWKNLEIGSPTYGIWHSSESGAGSAGGPPVRGILSGALQGYEYALEDIVRVPRVAGDRTLMNAWFGAWNDQVGSARAHGVGLMTTYGSGGHNDGRWHLIVSPPQGAGDGVPANWLTLVALDVDTGIAVPEVEWQKLRLAIGCARGGVPYVRVYVDDVLAFERTGALEITCAFSLPWSIGAAVTGGAAGSIQMHGFVSHKWLRRVL